MAEASSHAEAMTGAVFRQQLGPIVTSLIAMTGDRDLAGNAPKARSRAPCRRRAAMAGRPALAPDSPRQPATGLPALPQISDRDG